MSELQGGMWLNSRLKQTHSGPEGFARLRPSPRRSVKPREIITWAFFFKLLGSPKAYKVRKIIEEVHRTQLPISNLAEAIGSGSIDLAHHRFNVEFRVCSLHEFRRLSPSAG
jgi:hypothetical protein